MERDIALVALFAALIAALGLLPKLTLGFGVPITAQSMGIMLCGTILGWKRGFLASLLFIMLVALGLPLLAGGRGGIGLFLSPSAGYLIGFPFAAAAAGIVMTFLRTWPAFWSASLASAIGGIIILYIPGILGMAVTLDRSLNEVALLGLSFLPGDLIKAVLAGAVTASILRFRPSAVLSRQ